MAVVVPDIPDLFEEAYARAGLELRTGNDLRNARRSFNLLTMEWQNRGLNLWTIASGTLSLSSGTAIYTMLQIIIWKHQIRTGTGTSQVDTNLTRISVSTYAQQSAKNTRSLRRYLCKGLPDMSKLQYCIRVSADTHIIFF